MSRIAINRLVVPLIFFWPGSIYHVTPMSLVDRGGRSPRLREPSTLMPFLAVSIQALDSQIYVHVSENIVACTKSTSVNYSSEFKALEHC